MTNEPKKSDCQCHCHDGSKHKCKTLTCHGLDCRKSCQAVSEEVQYPKDCCCVCHCLFAP